MNVDEVERSVTESLLKQSIRAYFSSTEERRLDTIAEILAAELGAFDILVSFAIPWGDWRHKWPEPARKAIIAMWSVPR